MNQSPDGARDKNPGTVMIIGLGQSMRGDDAAGLAAVRLWQQSYQASHAQTNLQVELAELPGIGLLNLLEGTSIAILVDAVHSNVKAGTIHILSEDQLDSFSDGSISAHGWGVAETLALGHKLIPTSMPKKLTLIGIEAGNILMGESLSPGVELALPEAAHLIEQLVSMR
jgi:hydrogenase maturation protease